MLALGFGHLAQHGKHIHARGDLAGVKAQGAAHLSRLGGVSDRLLDGVHHQQGFGHHRFEAVYLCLVNLVQHVDGSVCQGRVLFKNLRMIRRALIHQGVIVERGSFVVGAHKEQHAGHLALADGLRHGILHPALLDARVDDPRKVIGQRQVGIGLDEEQDNGEQDEERVRLQVFE